MISLQLKYPIAGAIHQYWKLRMAPRCQHDTLNKVMYNTQFPENVSFGCDVGVPADH